jgi:Ser-tRNA(Ala) deacylase AlaX
MTADFINNNNDNNNSVAAVADNAETVVETAAKTDEDKDPEPQVLPPTNMLYYTSEGNRLTTCRSRVLSIQENTTTTVSGKNTKNDDTTNNVNENDVVVVVDVCLDQTILHAQGGGQPTDFGRLQLVRNTANDNNDDDALEAAAGEGNADESAVTVHVDKVLLDRTTGVATHTGRLLVANPARTMMMLCVGDVVQVTVDEERRQILSECHTAGHGTYVCCCFNYTIVVGNSNTMKLAEERAALHGSHPIPIQLPSSRSMSHTLFFCLFVVSRTLPWYTTTKTVVDAAMAQCGKMLKPSKGYHFLDGPYVEYQGSIAATEKDALLQDLQDAYCQLVNQDIETKIELLSKDDANRICNRLMPNYIDVNAFADAQTQQIRVVTVAGYPCPCGGTHVARTGDLKARQWNITGIKSKKGLVRVKYGPTPAGKKA